MRALTIDELDYVSGGLIEGEEFSLDEFDFEIFDDISFDNALEEMFQTIENKGETVIVQGESKKSEASASGSLGGFFKGFKFNINAGSSQTKSPQQKIVEDNEKRNNKIIDTCLKLGKTPVISSTNIITIAVGKASTKIPLANYSCK